MSRRTFWLIATVMLAIGAGVRLNNVAVFSPLEAYDGFSHFSYIWFVAENWRVPLATAGWEFFQPPLYYAFMAGVWQLLPSLDPVLRLRIGTAVIAMLGLSLAIVSYLVVRRELPHNRVAQLVAAGLMLFVPVHLYSAGFLGNENLTAIFCAWSLLALLWVLRSPTAGRAAVLGVLLGLTMLTKFTGLVVVIGALGTIALRAVLRGNWRRDARIAAVAAAVMLAVCGWYYVRNVRAYGTPFKMSRETFMLQRYEHVQTSGHRGILEYVLFDPVILRRPQWPRNVPLWGDRYPGVGYSALRESVLTGVYANAWFDGYGGWVLPKVTEDDAVRHGGQILLTLGLIPSVLVLVGIWQAIVQLRRDGWNDTLVAMLLTFVAMMTILVQGTRAVPIHAAVKATYLMPVSVVFAFWVALGVDWLGAFHGRWLKPTLVACTVLAIASSSVFLQGRIVGRTWFDRWRDASLWQNAYGVVYYAAGDSVRARELFERAAEKDYHLGYENLAAVALDDDRPLEALHYLRNAARLQPTQSLGTPWDRALFNKLTRAEYLNTMAVIYDRLGWEQAAMAAALDAVESDRTMPEASYDLAILKLARATSRPGPANAPWRVAFLAQSRALLFNAIVNDPGFREARELAGTIEALSGNCNEAIQIIDDALHPTPDEYRRYPVITGVGDLLASSARRRRYITKLPEALRPEFQLKRCSEDRRDHEA